MGCQVGETMFSRHYHGARAPISTSAKEFVAWLDRRFKPIRFYLHKLLEDCHSGALQLPDFQRSWVWDEERIKSLIASVSRAFPVGALTTRHSSC